MEGCDVIIPGMTGLLSPQSNSVTIMVAANISGYAGYVREDSTIALYFGSAGSVSGPPLLTGETLDGLFTSSSLASLFIQGNKPSALAPFTAISINGASYEFLSAPDYDPSFDATFVTFEYFFSDGQSYVLGLV